jgi:hypothetical protein
MGRHSAFTGYNDSPSRSEHGLRKKTSSLKYFVWESGRSRAVLPRISHRDGFHVRFRLRQRCYPVNVETRYVARAHRHGRQVYSG